MISLENLNYCKSGNADHFTYCLVERGNWSISKTRRQIADTHKWRVLCECASELDRYLDDRVSKPRMKGSFANCIIWLRNEAEYLRGLLDVPPGVQLPPELVLLERIEAQRTRKVEDRSYVLASEAEALGWFTPEKTQEGAANAASLLARSELGRLATSNGESL